MRVGACSLACCPFSTECQRVGIDLWLQISDSASDNKIISKYLLWMDRVKERQNSSSVKITFHLVYVTPRMSSSDEMVGGDNITRVTVDIVWKRSLRLVQNSELLLVPRHSQANYHLLWDSSTQILHSIILSVIIKEEAVSSQQPLPLPSTDFFKFGVTCMCLWTSLLTELWLLRLYPSSSSVWLSLWRPSSRCCTATWPSPGCPCPVR